jgi:RecA-family ATPase
VNSNPVSGVNETAIETILSAPAAAESGRHIDAIKRLLQLKANGMPREAAVNAICELYPPGSGSKRKIKKEEFYIAYDGAPQLKPWQQSRIGHDSGGFKINGDTVSLTVYKHDGSKEDLPEQELKHSFSEFLKNVLGFRDDKYVWLAQKEEEYGEFKFHQSRKGNLVSSLIEKRPNECCEGEFLPSTDEWAENAFGAAGAFYAINPLKNGDSRKQDNVSRFLYTLVEHDSMPKEEQLALFKSCRLPIRAIVDTGGKSIHAIVRVDAADLKEYKERVSRIHQYIGGEKAGFDHTIDPVRFTRLPNCPNGECSSRQRLLATNIGAASFEEWECSERTGSTEWFDLDSLSKFDRSKDPDCRVGNRWLCKAASLLVQGYTGIGKSSFTLQMALHWAVGKEFFGLKPVRPLRTVFVQAENDKGDLSEPFQDITKDFTKEEKKLLRENFHVGREATINGAERFDGYVRGLIQKFEPDIFFFDPLLSYFGDDISKQKAASEFFRNRMQPIQNETGVIIVFVHHLGKPSQNSNGQRQGPAHYQGLGSSDIINWTRETIMLSEEMDGVFKMELGKRASRAGFKEAYLRHSDNGVLWERAEAIRNSGDAKTLKENRKRERLEEFVRRHETVTLKQMTEFADRFGYAQNKIGTALEALAQNSVDSENPIYSYQAHVNGQKRGSGVYSIHPKPKDGHVRTKDIDPNFIFVVNAVDQPF